jgi:hypothetical protein
MKLTFKVTKQEEITITPPLFLTNPNASGIDMIAILDERTVMQVYKATGLTILKTNTPEISHGLEDAVSNWQKVEEDEFMNAFNTVYKSMSLTHELVNDDLSGVIGKDAKL